MICKNLKTTLQPLCSFQCSVLQRQILELKYKILSVTLHCTVRAGVLITATASKSRFFFFSKNQHFMWIII